MALLQVQKLIHHGEDVLDADRTVSSGKDSGRGICAYVSKNWCHQYTIRETICTPDLELLRISMRPFYVPGELGNIILCATYIPPSGNTITAAKCVAGCVRCQLQRPPRAPAYIL